MYLILNVGSLNGFLDFMDIKSVFFLNKYLLRKGLNGVWGVDKRRKRFV